MIIIDKSNCSIIGDLEKCRAIISEARKEREMLDKLYFVKFPDGGIYCPNAMGPMAFEAERMAQDLADTIDGGHVVERTSEYAVNWCKKQNAALFVTLANGKIVFSEDAALPDLAQPTTERVEGAERERILQVRNRQRDLT